MLAAEARKLLAEKSSYIANMKYKEMAQITAWLR